MRQAGKFLPEGRDYDPGSPIGLMMKGVVEVALELDTDGLDMCRRMPVVSLQLERWLAQVALYTPLIKQIIDQTQRRVLQGESVPASEKIFSLFETHTDIIIKALARGGAPSDQLSPCD